MKRKDRLVRILGSNRIKRIISRILKKMRPGVGGGIKTKKGIKTFKRQQYPEQWEYWDESGGRWRRGQPGRNQKTAPEASTLHLQINCATTVENK